ncbi:MAG: hydroxymethylglutaryl-CoA synthase family protein [Flavobacteriaceae bacterium]
MESHLGIDALGYYVPKLVVAMKDLAEARNIPFEKLNLGLGLSAMAIPDVNEDAASFAANALLNLIESNQVDPRTIGRVYLGTESAVDSSKPTATYAVGAVEVLLEYKYGKRAFKNCDVVDMTFACVGAVDALQNCLDWVRVDPARKAVVIASDVSKYDLFSTGEYTQGAGAVALLISHKPSILAISNHWGIGMESVNDFFKPRREIRKSEIIQDLKTTLNLHDSVQELDEKLTNSDSKFWSDRKLSLELFKEEPVFEGQYSNLCYEQRVSEALEHLSSQTEVNYIEDWQHLIFHLPYAFHGRRIIFENWLKWIQGSSYFVALENEIGSRAGTDSKDWDRAARKSAVYHTFVSERIAPSERASSEIGNMYTASIFMAFMSLLAHSAENDKDLSGQQVGFIAYGSGSKSKVFCGTLQHNWLNKAKSLGLFENLAVRQVVSVSQYESLHDLKTKLPLTTGGVRLNSINTSGDFSGYRNYR